MAWTGKTEVCDGVDNNCQNGSDEENASGCDIYFHDNDGDNYGDPNDSKCLCDESGNYDVINDDDCYDSDFNVKPGQTAWFSTSYGPSQSFDYNCDNSTQKEYTQAGSCSSPSGSSWNDWFCSMGSAGWEGSVATCGQTKDYINGGEDCTLSISWNPLPTGTCSQNANSTRQQRCR